MPGEDRGWDDEAARVTHRRGALGLPPQRGPRSRMALALSGGGVRSASFCLGVLQALAEAPTPAATNPAAADPPAPRPLLAQFDYLSTVGGGGYIGAFFASLFMASGIRYGSSPLQAADDGFRALQCDSPGVAHAGAPGSHTLAWLCENGRDLTPRGFANTLGAAVTGVRNWLAVQCVIGSVLLVALALLALALHLVTGAWPGVGRSEMDLLHTARLAFYQDMPAIWWSQFLWLPVASALLLALPPGMAYWLVYPNSGDPRQPVRARNKAVLVAIMSGSLCMLTVGTLTWLGVAACVAFLLPAPPTVAMYRTYASRALHNTLALTAALAALGVADTFARTCYLYSFMAAHPGGAIGPAVVIASLAWLVRREAILPAIGRQADTESPRPAMLPPFMAALLVLMQCVLWSWIVLWVRWDGSEPVDWLVFGKAWTAPSLATLVVLACISAIVVGRATGWLNLATLQPLHAARLTYAYLGASHAGAAPGDALPLDAYYDPRALAPLHLINITLNDSVDDTGLPVSADRKNRPLCIGPGSAGPLTSETCARFTVDGKPCRVSEMAHAFTVGDWIAISGAPVPIGAVRASTPATALLMGLANLRPGVWWQSRIAGDATAPVRRTGRANAILSFLVQLFRTQYCLFCELTARFHGMRHDWQYLSDGGHFDNTAVYELLRPEREVGLIVLCDGSRDPGFRFGDLARLIQLARIDFGLDIVVDRAAQCDPVLGKVFGTPDDFADQAPANVQDRFALLLNVHAASQAGASDDPPVARILLLKPRLTPSAPADLQRHGASHRAFPQDDAAEQSLDTAQWESYRALGASLGRRIATGPVATRLFAPGR